MTVRYTVILRRSISGDRLVKTFLAVGACICRCHRRRYTGGAAKPIMLLLVSYGRAETYRDDQRTVYVGIARTFTAIWEVSNVRTLNCRRQDDGPKISVLLQKLLFAGIVGEISLALVYRPSIPAFSIPPRIRHAELAVTKRCARNGEFTLRQIVTESSK